jgi:exodeoxyribonuclease-3
MPKTTGGISLMKFVSWNVNGLRACLQKDFLGFFGRSGADFFCLQETKLQPGQLELPLPGYEQYWSCAEKKGYSGTAVFAKRAPLSVQYGLGAAELDGEGRMITLEYEPFYLVCCYTPNSQDGLKRLGHRMAWDDAFREKLRALDAVKPLIACGDLNVAHEEIDLKNPGPNRGSAGFSDEEREKFSQLLAAGFTDSFRSLHPGLTGAYSWWSYRFHARDTNAGWRIDYFLVSDRLRGAIADANIYSDIYGSDHCPVGLELKEDMIK